MVTLKIRFDEDALSARPSHMKNEIIINGGDFFGDCEDLGSISVSLNFKYFAH